MPSIAIIAKLNTTGKDARQNVISALDTVSQYSHSNEPEVLKYAICLPRDKTDENSLYVIEEYATQSALEIHISSSAVQTLISFMNNNPTYFASPPSISTTHVSSSFTRPQVTKSASPFMVVATITYKPGSRAPALEGWKMVTSETQNNEPDTLSYNIYADQDNEQVMKMLEVYSNEGYFRNVHAKSKAVKENKERYGDEVRVGMEWVFLELVKGFLGREGQDKGTASL